MHDLTTFRRLVERHQGGVFALLHNLGLDAHACEDLAQEAFLTAWERRDAFDPRRGTFRAWLYTIARNRALNVLRKKRPFPVAEPPERRWARDPAPGDSEPFSQLDRALVRLPIEQRAAFVLAEMLGLAYGEIADVEGVAIGTIKSRVSRARETLRRVLAGVLESTS